MDTKGYSKVHSVLKPRSKKVFTWVQMFQNNWIGKLSVDKPKGMKCKLDSRIGVSIMPLSTYQYVNPSESDKQGKLIDGHGEVRTILKITMATPSNSMG